MGWISCGRSHNVRDEGSGIIAWEQARHRLCFPEHWRKIMYKLFIAVLQRLETFCKHQGKTLTWTSCSFHKSQPHMAFLKLWSVTGRWNWEGFPWKSHNKGEMFCRRPGERQDIPAPCLPLDGRENQGLGSGFLTAQGSILNAWILAALG